MTDDSASCAAFLAAPVVPAVAFVLFSPGLGGGFSADFGSLAGLAVLGYLYSLLAVGLLGLPTFLILRQYSFVGLAATTTEGVLLGGLVAVVLRPPASYLSAVDWLWQVSCIALVGGATGLAFWTVRVLCLGARGGNS